MPSYFRKVPSFEYVSRDPNAKIGDYVQVKNLFKRGEIRPDIFGNLAYFEKYKIIGDDRPDNVAYEIYDDPTLDWIVLLSNNIINIQTEWPLTQNSFDTFLKEKYASIDISNMYLQIVGEVPSVIPLSPEPQKYLTGTMTSDGNYFSQPPSKENCVLAQDTQHLWVFNGEVWEDFGKLSKISDTYFKLSDIPNYLDKLDNDRKTTEETLYYIIYNGIHHYESIEVKNSKGVTILPAGLNISPDYSINYYDSYIDEHLDSIDIGPIATPITIYEYEERIEDAKRNIYVLKSRYLNIIIDDLEEAMRYKEGSSQYKTETLKRADDIRLYS